MLNYGSVVIHFCLRTLLLCRVDDVVGLTQIPNVWENWLQCVMVISLTAGIHKQSAIFFILDT